MRARSNRGFTILELLVAFLLSMALFSLVITLFVKVTDFRRRTERAVTLTRTAGGVFRLMRRDLEGAYVAKDDFHVEPDRLQFWTATGNRFGARTNPVTQSHEILRVDYTLADGVLYSTVTRSDLSPPPQILARAVESFVVAAFDQNNNPITSPADLPVLPVTVRLTLTFFTGKGYDKNGDGKVDPGERVSYFDADFNGMDDPYEISDALAAGRLRRYSENVVLPAGGP